MIGVSSVSVDAVADRDGPMLPIEVAALEAAVAGMLGFEFNQLDGDRLAQLLPTMDRLRNQIAAADARFVEALDGSCVWARRGHANVTAMLRSSNCHPGDAGARARRPARLPKMRLVEAAFRAGDITVDHVRVLGELTGRRWRDLFTEAESYLLASAVELSWKEFCHVIDVWKVAADPDEPDLKHQSDMAARELFLSRSFNHRGILNGTLTPEARVIFSEELDRITRRLLHHDRTEAKARLGRTKVTGNDLARSPAQRRHDAIVIMAQRSAAADPHGVGGDPIVHIRVSQQSAEAILVRAAGGTPDPVDPADFECEFDDGTPMADNQFLKYWAFAKVHAVVVGQTGAVLSYGTGRTEFTRHQKAAVAYRDRYCACGCGLLARLCDIDHIIEVADLGPTDIANAQPKCRTSHTYKTEYNKRQRLRRKRTQQPIRRKRSKPSPQPLAARRRRADQNQRSPSTQRQPPPEDPDH